MKVEIDDAHWAQIKQIAKRDRLPVSTMVNHMLDFAIEGSEPDMDPEAVAAIAGTDFSAAPRC